MRDKDLAIINLRAKVKKARMQTAKTDVALRQRAIRAEYKPTVVINQYNDGFNINIDGEDFHYDQEDTAEVLVKVFKKLGITATYQEVC